MSNDTKPALGPIAAQQQAAGAPPAGTSTSTIPPLEGPPPAAVAHSEPIAQNTIAGATVGLRRLDLLSIQELDPATLDPDRHYRWVNAVNQNGISIARHKRASYVVETYRQGGPKPIAQPDDITDGTIRMGDLILMSCPKTLRQERQVALHKVNEQRLTMNTAMTKEQARKMGVKFIQDEQTGVSQ
jgi:hypothetical protein